MSNERAWHERGGPCNCHPACRSDCRAEEHPINSPCVWPDCLTPSEMRAALIELASDR